MSRGTANRLQLAQRGPSAVATLGLVVTGPLIWAAHFTFLYGGHTLLCAYNTAPETAHTIVLVATGIATAAILLFLAMAGSAARALGAQELADRPAYLAIARGLALLSGIAVLWGGAAVMLVAPCVGGR